jgi:hypothetical protein
MSEPPHRKRFQIHLSTAIVMMFVMGAISWPNLAERSVGGVNAGWKLVVKGWPFWIDYRIIAEDPAAAHRSPLGGRSKEFIFTLFSVNNGFVWRIALNACFLKVSLIVIALSSGK